eukprot:CAMPEP_0184511446 /NCGR_PEP_ID=MMETSP0198_2-20121128/2355_1 /TAXON_ID=1112570 /ORGANISM="Thraustochytrium sp., Strain LLF1b" /LENGTH=73 /DNA_ID=CAMNT_0026901411 /DNA_START=148 /DNA_END=369 /DNA_ORIENTATION=-
MASRLLDFGQRALVLGLVGASGVLLVTTVRQGQSLVDRRHQLDAKVKQLEAEGADLEKIAAETAERTGAPKKL